MIGKLWYSCMELIEYSHLYRVLENKRENLRGQGSDELISSEQNHRNESHTHLRNEKEASRSSVELLPATMSEFRAI
jgi:hypothetical protein